MNPFPTDPQVDLPGRPRRGRGMKRLVLLLAAMAVATSAGGPRAAGSGPFTTARKSAPSLEALERQERAAALDSLSREIETGLNDLKRHYLMGGVTPLPPTPAIEFLHLRGFGTGRPEPRDLALGLVAVWSSSFLNDYLKHGLPAPGATGGSTEKTADQQAGLLAAFTGAYRISGREMFKTAALLVGDDLVSWAVHIRAKTLLERTTVDPAPAAGPRAGAEVTLRVAAALLEGAAVIGRPAWRDAGLAVSSKLDASGLDAAGGGATGSAGEFRSARPLLACLDAAMCSGSPAWRQAAVRLARRLRSDEVRSRTSTAPLETAPTAWAALALLRFGAYAHDDSSTTAALSLLGRIRLTGVPPARDPGLFAARAAAACALQLEATPAPLAYIVAEGTSRGARDLLAAALSANRPGRLISLRAPDEPDLLYPPSADGTPLVYVCSGELCAPPTDAPDQVRKLLETFALPDRPPGSGGSGLPR